MLKQSVFNFIWPVEDSNSAVLYNSFTGATLEINKKYLELLDEGKELRQELNEEQSKIRVEFATCGFLVEDYIDEVKVLKYRNNSEKFSKDTLSLTILPTNNCNLRCFYCFQDRTKHEFMTQEVQEGILQFVLKNMNGVKNIEICWFGGEPLMAWDIICNMTQKLQQVAEKHGSKYRAFMVTNGYLLNDEKINKLKELDINTIQITLDGTPELHSKRKGIKGDPELNFEFILNQIKKLLQDKIKVNIRVNIDKANVHTMNELLERLAKANLHEANIYPAMIESYTDLCCNIESGCLQRDEFVTVETYFYKAMLEKGLIKDLSDALPKLKGNSCIVDQINSFSIDTNGYVYKCWNTIGDYKEMIADVLDNVQNEEDKKRMRMKKIFGMTWDPLENAECISCKLLPICMGGCPYRSNKNNKPDCLTIKDNLKDIILYHIVSKKINSIFQ